MKGWNKPMGETVCFREGLHFLSFTEAQQHETNLQKQDKNHKNGEIGPFVGGDTKKRQRAERIVQMNKSIVIMNEQPIESPLVRGVDSGTRIRKNIRECEQQNDHRDHPKRQIFFLSQDPLWSSRSKPQRRSWDLPFLTEAQKVLL